MAKPKNSYARTSVPAAFLIAAVVPAATLFLPMTFAKAAPNPLLAARQIDSTDISPFTKWTALLPRYEMQRAVSAKKCIGPGCMNQQWEKTLQAAEGKPVAEQIATVNKFFNKIKYVADNENYGISDYWQTPYEMMERGGDCEDYAIAKYISLKRLGVSEENMRLIIVRDNTLNGSLHAVLEVQLDGKAQILDNQEKQIQPADSVYRYKPIYAINQEKWWAYK